MLRNAPANAAPLPKMNSSAAPGEIAFKTIIAAAEPKMLTARYCGLRIQGPFMTRTMKKLENNALRIMSGTVASISPVLSQSDTKITLNQCSKMKAFAA